MQAILEKHRGTVPEKTLSKSAPAKASGGVSKAASEPSVSTSSAGSSNAATKKQKAAGNKQTKVNENCNLNVENCCRLRLAGNCPGWQLV